MSYDNYTMHFTMYFCNGILDGKAKKSEFAKYLRLMVLVFRDNTSNSFETIFICV